MVVGDFIRTLAENASNSTGPSTDVFISEGGAQWLILIIGIVGLLFGIL